MTLFMLVILSILFVLGFVFRTERLVLRRSVAKKEKDYKAINERVLKIKDLSHDLLNDLNASPAHQLLLNDLMDLLFKEGELHGYLKKHL